MATPSSTITFNSLIASTMRNFKPMLVDNIIADSILLSALGNPDVAPKLRKSTLKTGKANGIVLEDSPGTDIQFPIFKTKNSTVATFNGFDLLDVSAQDPFSAASYDWSSIAGSMALSNEDLDKNQGKAQIFSLLQGHMDVLKLSLSDTMTDKLLGIRASAKDPWGLLDVAKDDPTTNPSYGNLGGIDASTESYWRNQIVNHAAATFGTDQTGTGMTNLKALFYACSFGSQHPSLALAGNTAYSRIERAMINQARYNDVATDAVVNAGFNAFSLFGMPFVREPKIETVRTANSLSGDAIYMLNIEYLKLHGMKKRWFEPSEVKEPSNQDIIVQHIITRMQFCTNGRRYQGVMFNVA